MTPEEGMELGRYVAEQATKYRADYERCYKPETFQTCLAETKRMLLDVADGFTTEDSTPSKILLAALMAIGEAPRHRGWVAIALDELSREYDFRLTSGSGTKH